MKKKENPDKIEINIEVNTERKAWKKKKHNGCLWSVVFVISLISAYFSAIYDIDFIFVVSIIAIIVCFYKFCGYLVDRPTY